MVHKIENKKLSIEIFGTTYEVSKPKFKQIVEMEEKLESLQSKEKMLYIQSKLIEYGLPKEVLDELDGDAFVELISVINGTKKN
jgi:hypothetical protein